MVPKDKKFFITLLTITGLYAAHTSPLYFAIFAMPTILRAEGTPLTIIGLLGTLMIPWGFKFLWAPWLDRYYNRRLGKRKTWIIPTQIAIVIVLCILLFTNPTREPGFLYFLLISLSFFAATQDIASGAFVMEQLTSTQRNWGNYAQVIGTTLGSALGGAFILFCYGHLGWKYSVISILSLSIFFLFILSLSHESKQICFVQRQIPSIFSFIRRQETRQILYVCLLYRCCEGLVMGMQQPFLVDKGIPVSTIGLVMGVSNLTLGLLSAGLASYILKPLGEWRMLILLGIIRSITYLGLFTFAYLKITDNSLLFMIIIINMATRLMEMVVLYTIFMNRCSSQQAGTDYSILVCGELMIYMLGISMSGFLADRLGYIGLFLLGSLMSIPSAIMSTYLLKRNFILNGEVADIRRAIISN